MHRSIWKCINLDLPNGAYKMGEDGVPIIDPSLVYDNENRVEAAVAYRLLGLSNPKAEKGYSDTMKNQMKSGQTNRSDSKE